MISWNPNTVRIERCEIDPTATIVGWANIYNTFIASGCLVGPFVEIACCKIGRNSRIGSHTFLVDAEIGEETFIAHGVMGTNDLFSDVQQYESLHELRESWKRRKTYIGSRTRIGSGAVILPVRIGDDCIIGAGAVVTNDVPAGTTVAGVPARVIRKHVDEWGFS